MLHARIARFDMIATVALFENLVLKLNVASACNWCLGENQTLVLGSKTWDAMQHQLDYLPSEPLPSTSAFLHSLHLHFTFFNSLPRTVAARDGGISNLCLVISAGEGQSRRPLQLLGCQSEAQILYG